jgi:hypothetical protein
VTDQGNVILHVRKISSVMTEQQSNKAEKILPRLQRLSSFFQNELSRMRKVIGSEAFSFIVNGRQFERSIYESVFLSLAVEKLLLNDFGSREFFISDSSIDSNDFSILLNFIRLFTSISASSSKAFSTQKSLLTICRSLKNKELELMVLTSSEDICQIVQSQSISGVDIDIKCCASEFYSYSITTVLELSIDTFDAILSSNSLRIIDEDWLLNVLLEISVDHSFLFNHLRLEYLNSESINRFYDSIDYLHLTDNIWTSVINCLKGLCDDSFRMHQFFVESVPRFESPIVSTFPEILNEFRNRKLKLLYRGSRDGFNSSDFHTKCNGQNDTITFICTTKDFIFGGYTPLSWDSTGGSKDDSSHCSFIFPIINPHNFGPRKFTLKPDLSKYAICCHASYGPVFGYGHTICVSRNCIANNSSYARLSGYVNDTGLDDSTVFTGETNFTMKEIELFALTE